MEITLTKNKSTLLVFPADPVLGPLMETLRFNRITPLYGEDAMFSKTGMDIESQELYQYDAATDTLTTFAPLLDRVYRMIVQQGHTVSLLEVNRGKDFDPRLDEIQGIDLRGAQIRMLASVCSCDYGQFNGITGMGKSVLITQICRLFPYRDCRIVVCAQQRPVVDALRRGLEKYFPGEVGQVGGGKNTQRRITVSTARSLQKIDPSKIYLLMYDEVHTAAGKDVSSKLIHFVNSKMFGLSASTECRTDKADLLVEALFGPVRVSVDLKEGQDEGYIPPVDAFFHELYMPEITCGSKIARKREAVWRNEPRNYALACIARHWEQQLGNPQVLIMSDALEHVLFIKKYLPEYEVIYASVKREQLEKFAELGILPDDFTPMNERKKLEMIRGFESGHIRKVISTTTLGVGVDAPGLDVFIRADGGSSEISNIQFRGRITRGERGIYCDLNIKGDKNEEKRSKTRMKSARDAGWPVKLLPIPYPEAL